MENFLEEYGLEIVVGMIIFSISIILLRVVYFGFISKFISSNWYDFSSFFGVSIGFIVFFLLQKFELLWEVSFGVAFILGLSASTLFNVLAKSVFDKASAKNLTEDVQEFEKNDSL